MIPFSAGTTASCSNDGVYQLQCRCYTAFIRNPTKQKSPRSSEAMEQGLKAKAFSVKCRIDAGMGNCAGITKGNENHYDVSWSADASERPEGLFAYIRSLLT